MTWKVMAKPTGAAGEASTAPTLCDTPERVVEIYNHFVSAGYKRVWIEDVDGRELSPPHFGIADSN